ncbi:MAG: GNAT family N-acetyltransferase [Oscillospiraceae bacterium]|nr:GNAT family N-acetyltransferase [Oscillospiraceae bacterium]
MNLNTVDFEELLRIGAGKELYRGADGRILLEEEQDGFCVLMSDILDGKTLLERLRALQLPPFSLATVKSVDARRALEREYGFDGCNPCTQWVYCLPEPPQYPACDIRPLTADYAETAGEQYHQNFDYVRDRIAAGKMWGLFEDGTLAGFIGVHTEGAMGMLEIYPAYRKRGYGYALEAFLIGRQMETGATPYCHVIDGNDASVRLQKKLGLQKADLPAIWCWKENDDMVQMT